RRGRAVLGKAVGELRRTAEAPQQLAHRHASEVPRRRLLNRRADVDKAQGVEPPIRLLDAAESGVGRRAAQIVQGDILPARPRPDATLQVPKTEERPETLVRNLARFQDLHSPPS